MSKYLFLLLFILPTCKPNGYNNNYLSFTNYHLSDYTKYTTSEGVVVYSNQSVNLSQIDKIFGELEECLQLKIRRDWVVILIPDDWFYSSCSDEQLLPYAADPSLCRAKGLVIPVECEWLSIPTKECPCVCDWRVATQEDYIIITPPNLKLLKAELARMITGINNPWTSDYIRECL